MAHLTQLLDVDFEVAQGYATGELDTQVGWAKIAGGGAQDYHVVVGSLMSGVQSLSYKNGAGVESTAYEKSLSAARVAGTDQNCITFQVKLTATVSAGAGMFVSASAGAGNYSGNASGNTSFVVGVTLTGGVVRVTITSQEGSSAIDSAFALDAKATLRVEIAENNTFNVMLDADSDGEGWVGIGSGTLITGMEAISRVQVGSRAVASGDDTILIDNIRAIKRGAYVKVSFGDQPQRMAKLVTAVQTQGTEIVVLTADVYDEVTGILLEAGKTTTMHVSELDPAIASGRIDAALQRIVTQYDNEARVAEVNTSGQEVLL